MLLLVHNQKGLLDELRREVNAMVTSTIGKSGSNRKLDITSPKKPPSKCLHFQEVVRYRYMGISVHQVMEDTVLGGRWLLRKDCMIQMTCPVVHKEILNWGADVDNLNSRPVVIDQGWERGCGKRSNSAACLAFGPSTTSCRGRHFEANEVLAVVTMFIMEYDVESVDSE